MPEIDYSDLGFPPCPDPPPTDPYYWEPELGEIESDQYCHFCGNGRWKHHAPWCAWADRQEADDA
jgi:hypothetical protein